MRNEYKYFSVITLGTDSGVETSINETSAISPTSKNDTEIFSFSGGTSIQSSSQNSSTNAKSDPVHSENDEATYRAYRIRKTHPLLKECIRLKIEFREKYVNMSKTFLETPDKMALPDIELLHLKCSQAIDGKVSDTDGSSDSEDETCPVPLMSRKKHKEFSQNQASYEQSWMGGPAGSNFGTQSANANDMLSFSQIAKQTHYKQVGPNTGYLPPASTFFTPPNINPSISNPVLNLATSTPIRTSNLQTNKVHLF